MLKPYFRSIVADRILYPVRQQIAKSVPEHSKVIDIGCGTGSLLELLSPRIKKGTGIDNNREMIEFAQKRAGKLRRDNLYFKAGDFFELSFSEHYGAAVLSLVVHSLDRESRLGMLKKVSLVAEKVIIADYVPFDRFNLFTSLDEILAGHYKNFREYIKNKVENLIEEAGLVIEQAAGTKYKEIGIWVCRRK